MRRDSSHLNTRDLFADVGVLVNWRGLSALAGMTDLPGLINRCVATFRRHWGCADAIG
jgi:hypothetical protein